MSDASQEYSSERENYLNEALAPLTHLNLSGLIQYDETDVHGHGGFCDLLRGVINRKHIQGSVYVYNPSPRVGVAIKRLRVHIKNDAEFIEPFVKELNIWVELNHWNILPLFGYDIKKAYPSFVSEWMGNGSASRYVKANQLSENDLLQLAIGIARGLEYLHEKDIVHSDLKAANVLISPSNTPLICDFGISRVLGATLTGGKSGTDTLKGSLRWMAPELFDLEGKVWYSKESDIWAFGMTVLELITKNVPYDNIRIEPVVMFAIVQGKLPSQEHHYSSFSTTSILVKLFEICKQCWVSEPRMRATIKSILVFLHIINPHPDTIRGDGKSESRKYEGTQDERYTQTPSDDETQSRSGTGEELFTGGDGTLKIRKRNEEKDPEDILSNVLDQLKSPSQKPSRRMRSSRRPRSLHQAPLTEPSTTRRIMLGVTLDEPVSRKCCGAPRRSMHTPLINRLLADSNYIQLDFSSQSLTPLAAAGNWQLIAGETLDTDFLKGPPTRPPLNKMCIACEGFGRFKMIWIITVKPSNYARSVTCIDLLSSVHTFMHTAISQHDWDRLNLLEMYHVMTSYTRRVRSKNLDYESLRGACYIDVLSNGYFFNKLRHMGHSSPGYHYFSLDTHV